MKIKMIDLLVKIANGEESTKVKTKHYSNDWGENDFLFSIYKEFEKRNNYEIVEFLNDYVEIIEEPKKIEKINRNRYPGTDIDPLDDILDKLDELIDEINNLKEK